MPEPAHRLTTAILILGRPGSGKTSLLATFSEYLWETFGKVLMLYSWDGGAVPTRVQVRVQQGLIRFCRALTRSADGLGIDTLYYFTRGYWPKTINPATGEMSPAVELIPPITTEYTLSCPKGHPLGKVPVRSLIHANTLCDECKVMYPETDLQVLEAVRRTRGFEQVGGVAYDGLTSMTASVLDFMDHERGHGRIGGEKSSFGGAVQSGTTKYGGNNRADIGFAQTRGREFIANTRSIPYLNADPVFTALSNEGTDEGGVTIVGPKLPGQAATPEAPSWFGNVVETGKVLDEVGREHWALYLRPYTDSQGRQHLLKTSASPFGVPDKYVDPLDEPWKEANLGRLLKALDADLQAGLTEAMPGVPGLAAIEYGAPSAAASALPPPAASEPAASEPQAPTLKRRPKLAVPGTSTTPLPVAKEPSTAPLAAPPPGAKPPARAPTAAAASTTTKDDPQLPF